MTTLTGLPRARDAYARFIALCADEDGGYRLTPNAASSPYALCFAIFGLHLLRDSRSFAANGARWDQLLRQGLAQVRQQRRAVANLGHDKFYLQLLTFTLSALSILGTLRNAPLRDEVLEVLPTDLEAELMRAGCFKGAARSGNHAMFIAILLLHAQQVLARDSAAELQRWVQLHLQHRNRYGFWGDASSMSHLQFQNGYHQYEILEYLGTEVEGWHAVADHVASLADAEGHFAPYPGGGGCYDYDAVFLITGAGQAIAQKHRQLLTKTAETILSEQNTDGGFGESLRVRPRSLGNLSRTVSHVVAARGVARRERIRQGLTLLRPKHDRIQTHWSAYSRRWDESDLWDSWFRMLTVGRIDVVFNEQHAKHWGFVDFPGIGYHPSLRGDGSH